MDGKSALKLDDGERALPAGAVGLRPGQRAARFRNLSVKTGKEPEPLALKQTDPLPEVSGMWRPVRTATSQGQFAVVTERPCVGARSQLVSFSSDEGEVGVENQGLYRRGTNFLKGREYEGYVWVRADSRRNSSRRSRAGTVRAATPSRS